MPITASAGAAKFEGKKADLDDLIKRRFFFRQAFEIYGGVGGFFKGVARGVAGVVVKPVVGVLDGATQVVEGIGTAAGGGAAPRASHVTGPLRFVRLPDSEECALRGTEPLGD